jgi:hypothetical protein
METCEIEVRYLARLDLTGRRPLNNFEYEMESYLEIAERGHPPVSISSPADCETSSA